MACVARLKRRKHLPNGRLWMQGERRREKETETAALASSYPAIVHKSWKEGEGHRQQILLSFSKQCRKLRSSETPLNVLSSNAQAIGDRDAVHLVHLSVHDALTLTEWEREKERKRDGHWVEIGSESWEWYGMGSSEQSRIRTSK